MICHTRLDWGSEMTIAFWCVYIASVLPLVWIGFSKFSQPGYSNRTPRNYLDNVTGLAKRAKVGSRYSWEAFAPFAAGVLVASYVGVDQSRIDFLAMFLFFAG
jgi:uncharacterized MAPEG superfamily protein